MIRRIIFSSILLVAVAFPSTAANFRLTKGSIAPKFAAFRLEDALSNRYDFSRAVKFADILGKKPVYLSFFTEWCESCKVEISELEKIHSNYRAKGLEIYLVLVKSKNDVEADILRKVSTRGYTIPVIYHKFPDTIFPQYLFQSNGAPIAFPVAYSIDRTGKIITARSGFDVNNTASEAAWFIKTFDFLTRQ